MNLSVVKEGPGNYAVYDNDKVGNGPVSAAVVLIFRTERDARRFCGATLRAKGAN